jgi:hypothetical protein
MPRCRFRPLGRLNKIVAAVVASAAGIIMIGAGTWIPLKSLPVTLLA